MKSLKRVKKEILEFEGSSLASVFEAGYNECSRVFDSSAENGEKGARVHNSMDNVQRALGNAVETELAILESRLSLLATTGSTGPFIGLFGTVWGIMNSFQKIGDTGMASLAVVAPGISEALIATAVGLAAAIPASIAYNHYVTQIKKDGNENE